MNTFKTTLVFLVVLEIMLHAFSLVVSYAPLSTFLSAYTANEYMLLLATGVVLVFIELAVYFFPETALKTTHAGLLCVFIPLALLAVGVSGVLTTKGAGVVVVQNTPAPLLTQEDSTTVHIKAQLAADRERVAELSQLAQNRKWKVNTESEAAELNTLQSRIQKQQKELIAQMKRKQAQNDVIIAEAQAKRKSLENTHMNFGFITQVLIVLVMFARNYLNQFLDTSLRTHVKQSASKEPTRQQRPEPSTNQSTLRGQPTINPTTPATTQRIIKSLYANRGKVKETARTVGKDKSLVSRTRKKEVENLLEKGFTPDEIKTYFPEFNFETLKTV